METKVKLGISKCLLGEKVRYDGGHKLDSFLLNTLGKYVEYVAVCPEVECGFSIPREPLRLVGNPDSPRLLTTRTREDYTDLMMEWSKKRVTELEKEDLCGFIFKSKSPSSGMERVKVYNESGTPVKKGVGLFARAFIEHFPLLPVEEEGRLQDPVLRENFVERIFTFGRWRDTLKNGKTSGGLVEFHTKHKLLIMSHSQKNCTQMGRIVAQPKDINTDDMYEEYQRLLMESLSLIATPKKHSNVLQHMMGYFKNVLSSEEKQELLCIIDQYRTGDIPLIVPVTLINHYVMKYGEPYLKEQFYLHPHPIELQLRNHA